MSSPIKWPPFARPNLDAATAHALERLETAESFEGHADDYEIVCAEGKRRASPAFWLIVLSLALFSAPVAALVIMSDLPSYWMWSFLLAVPFATLMANVLQGSDTMKLETRVHRAIEKWRIQAGVDAVRRKL